MHFNLRGALGIGVPVLLGGAVALGAAVLPANAQTFQDTALAAGPVTAGTFGGGSLNAVNNTQQGTIVLQSGGAVTWSLHGSVPSGISLSGTTISYSGPAQNSGVEIIADATDKAGNAEALEIPLIAFAQNAIRLNGALVTVSLSNLARTNVAGTVVFSASSSEGNNISFAQSKLPNGLASGDPVLTYVGGTAAPGTYGGVVVTATDSDGAVLNGVFTLTLFAQQVVVSNYGDEVNRFGNGFDVYQQHQYPGAIIAGWTATQADPATHFLRNNGTHQGAFQYEYAPSGSGVGLCVSDPGGGWASDPLRDGLILTPCNSGPWQQFVPQSDGSLRNVATGLVVSPNGTGAQLRGTSAPTPWGGSFYNWTPFQNLPG
jgi:hypothetical protein